MKYRLRCVEIRESQTWDDGPRPLFTARLIQQGPHQFPGADQALGVHIAEFDKSSFVVGREYDAALSLRVQPEPVMNEPMAHPSPAKAVGAKAVAEKSCR